MVTTLVVVVVVTPVRVAMPIAIDPVAVLVCVRPTIRATITDNATRHNHEGCEGAQCGHPMECIHSFVSLKFVLAGITPDLFSMY